MKITNIKVSDNNIIIPKNSIYNSCQKFLHSNDSNSNSKREHIEFDLIDTDAATANAIRRVLSSEIDILCLNFDIGGKNVNENNYDPYILEDYICSRMNMIPLGYDITKTKQILDSKLMFEINVTNDTNEVIFITTDDIKQVGGSGGNKVSFFKGTRLTPLSIGCTLHIKNIHLKLDRSGKITPITNVVYKSDQNSLNDSKSDQNRLNDFTKHSSTFINHNNFHIEFDTMGIDSLKLLHYSIDILIERLKNAKEKKIIDKNSERCLFNLVGETYTIANMIVTTIFILDKNIPFVTFEQPHPLKNEIHVIVKHINPEQIFDKVIDKKIKELSELK